MLWPVNEGPNTSPLIDSIVNSRYRQALLLVQSGTDVNVRISGRTPLIMVSIYLNGPENWQNREKFGKLLLDANADPNITDFYGLTPLMHASINGQCDYVSLLLSYNKTNYEVCDKAGNNAIMLAARYGQVDVIQEFKSYLIHKRANCKNFLDHRNCNEKSAINLANEGDFFECVNLISSLQSTLNQNGNDLGEEMNKKVGTNNLSPIRTHVSHSLGNAKTLGFLRDSDSLLVPQSKHSKPSMICSNNKNIKLPPINGNRFVEYNDFTNDRKTI